MSDNIIHLFGEPPAIEGAPSMAERKGFCWPHAPRIDAVSRTVTCARCKAQLDPVDVLIDVASRHKDYKRMLEETSTMRAQLVAMQEEEKRVKARTKSHSRKDAAEAVAAERTRHQHKMFEVMTRTAEMRRALNRIDQLARLSARETDMGES